MAWVLEHFACLSDARVLFCAGHSLINRFNTVTHVTRGAYVVAERLLCNTVVESRIATQNIDGSGITVN